MTLGSKEPVGVDANPIKAVLGDDARLSFYESYGKRILDVLLAALALIVLAPVCAACVIAVRLDSPGPVLFRHKRIGRNGRPFHTFKFRTMVDSRVDGGREITVSGDPRITRTGRFLRAHKLDELPQFVNVLRGEMSLVGPRPEVAKYVACYTASQRGVLRLRPGITGAASLSAIKEEKELAEQGDPDDYYLQILLPRKLSLDLDYMANVSLVTDVTLLAATARRLF